MSLLKNAVGLLLIMPGIFAGVSSQKPPKPNIVMIVADDLGFNDIGFHGSDQIPTPNIDALGAYGINLNRYYVAPMCSPSRSSLMTGKYASTVGMQKYVITPEQPFGLGLCEKIMPEYLKEAGYATHIVGKWHLGYYKKEYTPTLRGFDSHIGYLGAMIDFYNHSLTRLNSPYTFDSGYDMRKNLDLYRETVGVYATDLFTQESETIIKNHDKTNPLFLFVSHLAPHAANFYEPLQAPPEVVDKFSYIQDLKRRKYAAMVSILDDGVGRVVKALNEKKLLDNTIILFFSDNGAPIEIEHKNAGSNTPFRGQKESPWEGAVRSAAAIWSPLLKNRERTSDQLFHISDWVPTFAGIAGVDVNVPIDGKNIWDALSENSNNPRKDALLHLDYADGLQAYNHDFGYQSYISENYKYINGSSYNGTYDRWMDYVDKTEKHPSFRKYGESITNSPVGLALAKYSLNKLSPSAIEKHRRKAMITCNNIPIPTEKKYQCFPMESPCLFNIVEDPCERRNIASERPLRLRRLANEVNNFRLRSPTVRNKPGDENSNPGNFENTWTWWFDELGNPDFIENRMPCKCAKKPAFQLGVNIRTQRSDVHGIFDNQ